MAQVIDFGERAVATLRARVAEVEEANQDLIAFARGHSGAVAAIHAATLAAAEADGLDHLVHIVTQDWPDLLGVDAVAIALLAGGTAFRADLNGAVEVDPRWIERLSGEHSGVVLRGVPRGHPLFGPAAPLIRAEALVRLDYRAPLPCGLLVLGQRATTHFDTWHGSELLAFLGGVLARMVGRCRPR